MKTISVVIPCFNEEDNVETVYARTIAVFSRLPTYDYEIIFIDNDSQDRTAALLRDLAARDKRVKVILNARNFGHLRSPYHALMNATGDAALMMAADLQDPPEMILDFVRKWEDGFPIVLAVKEQSDETGLFRLLRGAYYWLLKSVAENEVVRGFHGYSLMDRRVIESLRTLHDPYPYFRGMLFEVGFPKAIVPFRQPLRKRGITKNNFYSLYDTAMLGLVHNSKVPLRMAILLGFVIACASFLVAMAYLVYKLLHWNEFTLGLAPVVIGIFLLASIQLIFLGVIGEYLGAVFTQVKNRPLVIERERINF
jgi:glycosyltransferase involved in cell wall biosynthesis